MNYMNGVGDFRWVFGGGSDSRGKVVIMVVVVVVVMVEREEVLVVEEKWGRGKIGWAMRWHATWFPPHQNAMPYGLNIHLGQL